MGAVITDRDSVFWLSLYRPIRPVRCISEMHGAAHAEIVWPACLIMPDIRRSESFM